MQPPTIPTSPLLYIPAVLLVGGMGTRLRALLPSTPKPLASIGKKPFLELLVRQLRSQGIRHIVMCTGYLEKSGHLFTKIASTRLVGFHQTRGALASVAVLHVENKSRYGTVQVAAG